MSYNQAGAAPSSSNPVYKNGAVAADAAVCSDVGVGILAQNGSAVDAAIASVLCIGVVNSHSSGIGGGGFMLVHINGTSTTIDFRETAPAQASTDMFTGFEDCKTASTGGQADLARCPSRLGGYCVSVLTVTCAAQAVITQYPPSPSRDMEVACKP